MCIRQHFKKTRFKTDFIADARGKARRGRSEMIG
jgi:hypothetical protein